MIQRGSVHHAFWANKKTLRSAGTGRNVIAAARCRAMPIFWAYVFAKLAEIWIFSLFSLLLWRFSAKFGADKLWRCVVI